MQKAAGGVRRKGVPWRGKGCHGELVDGFGFAALRIQPRGPAPGKQEKFAFFRQRNQLVRPWQAPFLPAAAKQEQVGVIVNIAFIVGVDHVRAERRCGHGDSSGALDVAEKSAGSAECLGDGLSALFIGLGLRVPRGCQRGRVLRDIHSHGCPLCRGCRAYGAPVIGDD